MATPPNANLRRWNSLFVQAAEPVVVLDASTRVLFANQAWENFTGRQAKETVGRICREISTDGNLDELLDCFAPPPEAVSGQPVVSRTLVMLSDENRVWRRIEFLPFLDENRQLLGTLVIVRDPDSASIAAPAPSQVVRQQWLEAREKIRNRFGLDTLIGRGLRHDRLLLQVQTAARSHSPVLLVGESGAGKRQVARAIHARGTGKDLPLVMLDPSALTPEMLEKALFGSSGDQFIIPSGSTILLGEITAVPRDIQAKLAAALPQSQVRLIATSTQDPEIALAEDLLRADFYFAVTVLVARIEPLRDRLDELPILAQHFLERINHRSPQNRSGFRPEALEILASYDWPGNLRELCRVVESAYEKSDGDLISAADLPAAIRGDFASSYTPPVLPGATLPLDPWLLEVEKRLIEQALQRTRHNKSKAADLLEISRPRLNRRIKELNIVDLTETSSGS